MIHRRAANASEGARAARPVRARAGLGVAVALLLAWPALADVPWQEPKEGYTREHILELWKKRPKDPASTETTPWSRIVFGSHSPTTITRLRELAEEPATRLIGLSGLAVQSDPDLFPLLKRTVERTDLVPEEVPVLVGLLMNSRHPEAQALAEAQWGRSPEWTQALLVHAESGRWKTAGRERLEAILWDVKQPSRSRILALKALKNMREVNGVELLRWAMSDVDPRLREYAVASSWGTGSLMEPMLTALQDTDEKVREAAVKSLEISLHLEGEPAPFDTHPHSPSVARAYALLTALAERPGSSARRSGSLLFRLANHADCHGDLKRAERFYREAVALPYEYDLLEPGFVTQSRILAFVQLARLLVLTGRPAEVERLLERLEDMEYSGRGLTPDLPWMQQGFSGDPAELAQRVRRELHAPLRLSVVLLKPGPSVHITLRNVSREVQHLELFGPSRKEAVPGTLTVLVDGARPQESWDGRYVTDEPVPYALRPGQSLTFTRKYARPKERHGRARLDVLLDLFVRGETDEEPIQRRLQAVGTVVLP